MDKQHQDLVALLTRGVRDAESTKVHVPWNFAAGMGTSENQRTSNVVDHYVESDQHQWSHDQYQWSHDQYQWSHNQCRTHLCTLQTRRDCCLRGPLIKDKYNFRKVIRKCVRPLPEMTGHGLTPTVHL